MTIQDTGYAPERWEFDGEVSRVFDDMLARSIPQYTVMRDSVQALSREFVLSNSTVLDLGTSRGEMIAELIDANTEKRRVHYVGLEISPPMLEAARERFQAHISKGRVDILEYDLREGLQALFETSAIQQSVSLITAILTVMFIPVECRQKLLQDIYANLQPGGAFIMVEKLLGEGARIDSLLVKEYYALKQMEGYSSEEIERKRLSLQGVLVPGTASHHIETLHRVGFQSVDCFWRWMNFAGFIAIK